MRQELRATAVGFLSRQYFLSTRTTNVCPPRTPAAYKATLKCCSSRVTKVSTSTGLVM